ncbi:nucleotide-binding alpha-beta plait domain-containing protein [Artemisia annua]|uniref:Nucleotide-binding alpha-beta plait domain-containing protein n=1 Tax=Artemisia annua TaxID=35608 RepID=A0A2U1PKF0_ARTAN|nr:nucleotide-binding alpha-beta plait domain-containing protein [Artemisia annua]
MVEGWQEVPARRNKGSSHNRGENKAFEDVTKLFVSNLPNGCIPGDVSEFMGYFGEVVNSYIARKRDKEGNRFGFVTFRKVKNTADLVKRMNGVKMGSCRLKINVARFAMENSEWREVDDKAGRTHNTKPHVVRNREAFVVEREKWARFSQTGGKSFREILEGKSSAPPIPTTKSIIVPDNVVAFFEIRGKSLIGRAKDLTSLTCLNKMFVEHGLGGFDIVYVGGLSILLKFQSKDEAMEFLLNKEVWNLWLSVLDLWEGQPLPFERVAWIKIHGVPINLAINEVFDDIAKLVGKIIYPSQICLDDGDISVGYVGVLVGDGEKINDSVSLKWKNKTFKTWLSEEPRVWDPECVGPVIKKTKEQVAAGLGASDISDHTHVQIPVADSGGLVNEKAVDPMEEGEIRIPLHGEVVENQGLHGELHGSEELAAKVAKVHKARSSNIGVDINFDISNVDSSIKSSEEPIVFSAIGNGPKHIHRPNKAKIRKRSHRVQNNIISPVDSNRPRKRNRQEEDDPFDLDRFIGILQVEESAVDPPLESTHINMDTGIADFPVHTCAIPEVSSMNHLDGSEVAVNGVESTVAMDKEVEETIKIGVALGMDLSEHKELVKNHIVGEGNNVVNQ